MKTLNVILTIAYRDLIKFLRDRSRIVATFIFPVIFVGVLGSSLQSNLGATAGFDFLAFTLTGVIGQVLFQSSASGVISLIEDRQNDFAQEMFIAPVSRYVIIFGKIIGEAVLALIQGLAVIAFGLVMGVQMSATQILLLIPTTTVIAVFGAAFGVLVMANLADQRAANQIFPFVLFPQFFLAGIFSPIKDLSPLLLVLSRIAPMTYAVDLVRSVFYYDDPAMQKLTLNPVWLNLLIIAVAFTVFLGVGTWIFVRGERNK